MAGVKRVEGERVRMYPMFPPQVGHAFEAVASATDSRDTTCLPEISMLKYIKSISIIDHFK